MKPPKWEVALDLATSKNELSTQDIMALFDVKKSTAQGYKSKVLEQQAKEKVKSWYSSHVNIKIAFELWGIDVAEIEKKLQKRKFLKTNNIAL